MTNILKCFNSCKGQLAVLIDPDKVRNYSEFSEFIKKANFAGVDYFFIGGSTVTKVQFEKVIDFLKNSTRVPVIIFPGGTQQLSPKADAILYLSLLSGRNPDYLIGHHVQSAPEVRDLEIEVIPTAYILIDGESKSSVAYVSQTIPIPRDKFSIAYNTALAGKFLGKQLLYFDAGSGAKKSVPFQIVKEASDLGLPIIIGGGIRDLQTIDKYKNAGANVIVIGNHIENHVDFLLDLAEYQKIRN